MALVARFVDSVTAGRTVRMDVNDGVMWRLLSTSRFDPPRAKRVRHASQLADGAIYPSTTYDDRVLELRWLLNAPIAVATAELQGLARELDRPENILEYQPHGADAPTFFLTRRLGLESIHMPTDGDLHEVEVAVPADPFGVGLEETLPAVTVYNDPAEGVTQNLNPFIETNAANWTGTGGTIARSTAQFHEGAASLLLTPDGVSATAEARNDRVAATAGLAYRFSAWVRCAVSRNVVLGANWHNVGGGFISDATTTVAVTANTWTWLDLTATAPANTATFELKVNMTGTPPAGNLLYIDEARGRLAGGNGGMCFDIAAASVKGDAATAALMRFRYLDVIAAKSAIAVRRRGTPSATPFVLQAEAMTLGSDTTLPGNDPLMSGAGSNYARTTFATAPTLNIRLQATVHPASASTDARGQYRVLYRYRKTVAGDVINVRLSWTGGGLIHNGTVALAQTTNMRFADLGLVSIPAAPDPRCHGYSGTELAARGIGLYLYAERVSGSGSLDSDELLLAPADDRLAFITWPVTSGAEYVYWDSIHQMIYTTDASGVVRNAEGIPDSTTDDLLLTPGVDQRIFFVLNAASTSGSDDVTDQVNVVVSYWPRYLYVRPATT